jgi:hypothetical protein
MEIVDMNRILNCAEADVIGGSNGLARLMPAPVSQVE